MTKEQAQALGQEWFPRFHDEVASEDRQGIADSFVTAARDLLPNTDGWLIEQVDDAAVVYAAGDGALCRLESIATAGSGRGFQVTRTAITSENTRITVIEYRVSYGPGAVGRTREWEFAVSDLETPISFKAEALPDSPLTSVREELFARDLARAAGWELPTEDPTPQ